MDTPHPRWCTRVDCTPSAHHGRRVEIRSLDGWPTITVQLMQATGPDTIPVVVLASDEGQVTMTLGQARAAGHVLRATCRRVRGEAA